ncbi:hypothetical protein EE612_003532 [Oryza sativa]|nr:hypothetical protein EE612_003532 [Oryza sativa]
MASPPAARARWSPSRKQIGIDLVFDVAFLLVLALHHLRVRADLLLPLGQLRVDLREAILLLLGDARHGLQRGGSNDMNRSICGCDILTVAVLFTSSPAPAAAAAVDEESAATGAAAAAFFPFSPAAVALLILR